MAKQPPVAHPKAGWLRWVTRGGRLEILILTAIFAAVIGLWVFGQLAVEVVDGRSGNFDNRILLALRRPGNLAEPIGPDWSVQMARDVTAFGSAFGLGVVVATAAGFLVLQRRWGLLTFVLLAVVSGTALALFLKELFHRPRPQIVPHLTDISTASFPSGHSMLSSVVYFTLAALLARAVPDWRAKIYFFVVATGLVGLIGFSRLYLGVHYPTDVLAGWAVGSAWAILCALTAHFIADRGRLPHVAELGDHPAA